MIYISVFILIVFIVIISFSRKNEKKSIVELNASIYYDGNQFVVANNDTFDFVHADISIDEYYKLRNYNLKAGETYKIWKVEFVHHNGTHYPQNRTPVQFSIWCELGDHKNGYFSKKIK